MSLWQALESFPVQDIPGSPWLLPPSKGDPSAQPLLSKTESSWSSEIDEAE